MADHREYYYACFMPAYESVPASSVADAIAIIRQHYPRDALGHDVAVRCGRQKLTGVGGRWHKSALRAWRARGRRKPVAYVRRTRLRLDGPFHR